MHDSICRVRLGRGSNVGGSAERFCHVIVTDLRDAAVTGFTVTQPFDRNENGIDRRPEIV